MVVFLKVRSPTINTILPMSKALYVPLQLSFCTFSCLYACSALSQVTSDNTVNTQVNQNGNVAEITGGETRGGNLFHSFQDFSVTTGNEAFFNNANNISNIFSRVTGGNISNIDGAIRANGSASLFLINPAGILFGENARLDIGGSFLGSTSSSILFEDGEFSAVDNLSEPVLTINAPIGLGFRDEPGDITNLSRANDGRGLEVNPDKNISLLGGNISFDGGIVIAPGGTTELGGLSAAGDIGINEDGSLSLPEGIEKADVSLRDGALVRVRAEGGGFINVNARNFSLSQESVLLGGIESGSGSTEAQAGDITINAESLLAEDNSQVSTATEGIGDAGNIFVNAATIEFTDEIVGDDLASRLIASTFGRGDAGDIEINASEIILDGSGGGAVTNVGLKANDDPISDVVGNAGNITINTDSIKLFNGAGLIASTAGQGNGGNVTINARELVSLDGRGDNIPRFSDFFNSEVTRATALKSDVRGALLDGEDNGVGNAGTVEVNTKVFSFNDGAEILTPTSGIGNAGSIVINALETVDLDNQSQIISQVFSNGQGEAGSIEINTDILSLNKSSRILSDTQQTGNSGDVLINAGEGVFLTEESSIVTGAGFLGEQVEGNAGILEINTGNLILENNSLIGAQTQATGNAGNVIIQAEESIIINGNSAILSEVLEEGIGNAGNIELNSNLFRLQNSSSISTSTLSEGQGDAGNITINVENIEIGNNSFIQAITENDAAGGNIFFDAQTLDLVNNAEIRTLSEGRGNAGNIQFNLVEDIILDNNSSISARAFQEADGGNLNINSRFIIAFPNGNNDITASAEDGQGGNITINTKSLLGIQERLPNNSTNDIDASSRFSLDGNVTINTPDINPVQGTTELPSNTIQTQITTANTCGNSQIATRSNLTFTGRGGVSAAPGSTLDSLNVTVSGKKADLTSAIPAPIETAQGKIQPARGVKITESGEVILTAYRTNNQGERIPEASINCARNSSKK